MAFNLSTFRSTVHSIGRNQYFVVKIPPVAPISENLTALARSTTIPAMTHDVLEVWYRGLAMKVQSRPTFPEWNVTFLCDEAHALRHIFLKWMEASYNVLNLQNKGHNQYKKDGISVSQLAANGTATSTVIFHGVFPSAVGEIEVNQEGNVLETFQATLTYDYYTMNSLAGEVVSGIDDEPLTLENNSGSYAGNVTIGGIAGVSIDSSLLS